MEQLGLVDASIRFRDLVLIGSHDAASFSIGGCQPYGAVAQCQRFDILQQLAAGVRVLDIRVAPTRSGGLSIWHGCLEGGDLLEHVLDPLRAFVQDNPQEVILLQLVPEFGRDYPPAQKKRTLDLVRETLGEYVLDGSHTSDLLQKWTLGDLRNKPKARVVVLLQSRFYGLDLRGKKVLADYGFASMDKWLRSLWFNTRDTETLLEYTLDEVARHGHQRKQFHCSQLVLTPGVGGLTDVLAALFGLNKLRPASLAYKLYKDHRLGRYLRENANKGWNLVLLDYIDLCPWVTYLMTALNFPVPLKVLFAAYSDDSSTADVTDSVKTCVCRDRVLYMDSVQELLNLSSKTGSLTVVYSLGDEIKVLSMAINDNAEMGDAMLVSAFVNSCEDDAITDIPMNREKGYLKGGSLLPDGTDVSSFSGTVIEFEKMDGAYGFKLCHEAKASSEPRELVFTQDGSSPAAALPLSSGTEKLPSFVDAEDTVLAENGELLVLISQQSLDRGVVQNQQTTITILEANGIKYKTLDGADLVNKERRNELFGISQLRAKYPQFFLVKDGKTTFWGDWDSFNRSNETGSLVTNFGGSLPVVSLATEEHLRVALKGADVLSVEELPKEMFSVPSDPVCEVLVLVSQQSLDRAVTQNQQNAITILEANAIIFTTLDGADPANKEARNELFAISELRGKYPQFFIVKNGVKTFYGDYEALSYANEVGSLKGDLVGTVVTAEALAFGESAKTDDSSRVATNRSMSATFPINSSPDESAPSASTGASVIVLISNQSFDRTVLQNQHNAMTILDSKGIGYTTVDGADPIKKEERNALFTLSGRRGKYPQFFVAHGEEKSFFGGTDEFNEANENGTLTDELEGHVPVLGECADNAMVVVSQDKFVAVDEPSRLKEFGASLPIESKRTTAESDAGLPLEFEHTVSESEASLPTASQSSNLSSNISLPLESKHTISASEASLPAASQSSNLSSNISVPLESKHSAASSAILPAASQYSNRTSEIRLPPESQHSVASSATSLPAASQSSNSLPLESEHSVTSFATSLLAASQSSNISADMPADSRHSVAGTDTSFPAESMHSILEMDTSLPAASRHSVAASDIGLSEHSTSAGELLILITYQTFDREVYPSQQNAMALLNANGIKYTTLIGDDPANKEVRDNLFEISEMHGIYPQFFGFQDGDIFFLGDYEAFCDANESGELGTWVHAGEP
jgi:hypothetical protein